MRFPYKMLQKSVRRFRPPFVSHEGWDFNSGNYLFTTDTK